MSELKFKFKMPDDESLAEYISVKGEKGERGDPTKLSQLENDTGFVTANTDALANYYTKAQTDSAIDADVEALETELGVPDGFFTDTTETISGEGQAITLNGTANAVFKEIKLYGNTEQDGTPTPENPVDVQVVTGDQTIIIADNDQQSQSYTIPLGDIKLRGIDDYKDYIYEGVDGWYIHKMIGEITLGTKNWTLSRTANNRNLFRTTQYGILPRNLEVVIASEYLMGVSGDTVYGLGADWQIGIDNYYNLSISAPADTISSASEMQTYIANLAPVLYVVLPPSSQTDVKITDATLIKQLEILKCAKSYRDTTIITVSGSLSSSLGIEVYKSNWSGTISGINARLNDDTIATKLVQKPYFFNNVADMKAYDLSDGDTAKTLGFYSANDGGEAYYKIRTIANADVVDEIFIVALADENLVAELQFSKVLNVKSLGCKADKSADCSSIIQRAIDKLEDVTLYFPHGAYKMDSAITSKSKINYKGEFYQTYTGLSDEGLFFDGTDGFVNCTFNRFEGMLIQNNSYNAEISNSGIAINRSVHIVNSSIARFKTGVKCSYASCIASKLSLHNNGYGVSNPVDSRFENCTLNANKLDGFTLQAGASDNIIVGCKIEWNEGFGIATNGACYNNVFANNVIDRNSKAGIGIASGCSNTTITGNVLRRNGAASTGTDSANIRLNNSPKVIVSNNTTAVGNSQDDGSGTNVPLYALYAVDFQNEKLMLLNNQLEGGTEPNPVYLLRTNNVTRIDRNTPVYDNLLINKTNATVTADGGSRTYTVPFPSEPATYSQGVYRKLVITTRTSSDVGYALKVIYALLYRQYGSLKVILSESSIKENLDIAGSYDTDNNVVLTVTNNTSTDYQVQINSYAV